jgi:transcriptional regulator with XRE-family HTH domain
VIDPRKLREARENAGLNRSQLSKRAGLARNVAHRLEDGSRGTNVTHATLTAIAAVLEVEPDSLLCDEVPESVPSATPEEPDASAATATSTEEPHPEAWRWG